MQNCFIVSALQHGRRENPLLENMQLLRPTFPQKMYTDYNCLIHGG